MESGAVVLNHAEVTGLRFSRGRVTGAELRDRLDGTSSASTLVLNATGPWVDQLRRMEDPAASPGGRLSPTVMARHRVDDQRGHSGPQVANRRLPVQKTEPSGEQHDGFNGHLARISRRRSPKRPTGTHRRPVVEELTRPRSVR